MSMMCSLVLLLCLSMNAWSIHHLGIMGKEPRKQDLNKMILPNPSVGLKMEALLSEDQLQEQKEEAENKESTIEKSWSSSGATSDQNPNNSTEPLLNDIKDSEEAISSGSVSVPLRVAHERHDQEVPGFNVDYLPPKTHPPSNN